MHPTLRAIFACCILTSLAAAEPQKILMIGNSLTYTWNIPSILEHFATATKRTLTITAHTTGGKNLTWHWTNASKPSNLTAHEAIAKGGYDVVILQEFSTPLMRPDGQEAFAKIVPEYVKAIKDSSMQAMFYMAPLMLKDVNLDGIRPLIEAHSKKVDELATACAPVALAFVRGNEKLPKIALIDNQTDRKYAQNKVASHQSPFGSYLAACVLYATIYRQSPVGLTFRAAFDAKTEIPIDAADAAAAQEIAWQVWQEYDQKHPTAKAAKPKEK
ncbi:MAG: hypothetical protein AAB263_04375 [Planctomycetota bacterium]|mgnify:FL=1